jgi:peptide/nickel transport system substrate-binding protein
LRAAGRSGRCVVVALWACACDPATPPPTEVRVAYPIGLATALPHETADTHSASILANVYEPLVDFGPNLALEPRLARSWRTTSDLDWVFDLRPGVTLHDGSPLSAADVVRALELARDDEASRVRPELAAVREIVAEPGAVRLSTRYPVPALPNRLASVPIFALRGSGPVGSGPYRLAGWEQGRSAELDRFASYWGARPSVATLRFSRIEDAVERLHAVGRGEVDLATDVEAAAGADGAQTPGARVVSRPGLTVLYLGFDCARERSPHVALDRNPFRDPRVRLAFALALDRQQLVSGPLRSRARVVEQVVAPEVFGANPRLVGWAPNPARSRALLAAAGFATGFEVWFDAGDGLVVRSAEGRELLSQITAQLRGIGVRLRPRPQPAEALLARIEARDSALYLSEWVGTSGDFGITAEYLLHTPGGGLGTFNGGGYSNPEVDLALEAAGRTLDAGRRSALLQEVGRRVHEEAAVVPLARLSDGYAVRDGLRFEPRLDRHVRGAALSWSERDSITGG